MNARHEPQPEFLHFLEEQTQRELRRLERETGAERGGRSWPSWIRSAALVLVSLGAGGGAVFAMERLQDSRELILSLERNRLEVQLAERRLQFAREVLEIDIQRHREGLIPQDRVAETEHRVQRFEYDGARLRLAGEELRARGEPIQRNLSAGRVGARDFVLEALQLESAWLERSTEFAERRVASARSRYEMGIAPHGPLASAERESDDIRAAQVRLRERLDLRAEFLGGGVDAAACEARDRIQETEYRLAGIQRRTQGVREQLEVARAMEAMGETAGAVAPLEFELESLELERQLVDLELRLLR